MLTTIDALKTIPQVKNYSTEFLELLLTMADQAVKDWLKRDIEKKTYTEYYSGDGTSYIIVKQTPIIAVLNLWFDPVGYYGFAPSAFASQTLQVLGQQYVPILDSGGVVSNRGMIQAISGIGIWFPGLYPVSGSIGKLAARRGPVWPIGQGNLKVEYTAGYAPKDIPTPIVAAVLNVVAFMAANMPAGGILQSENLGSYSYSRFFPPIGSIPLLGSTVQMLAPYREISQ